MAAVVPYYHDLPIYLMVKTYMIIHHHTIMYFTLLPSGKFTYLWEMAIEIVFFSFFHQKWWFSIAMLVITRG